MFGLVHKSFVSALQTSKVHQNLDRYTTSSVNHFLITEQQVCRGQNKLIVKQQSYQAS